VSPSISPAYGDRERTHAGPAGLAAGRKLLRSVFYKGMAASIVEALEAARAAGDDQWLQDHIATELAASDAATVSWRAASNPGTTVADDALKPNHPGSATAPSSSCRSCSHSSVAPNPLAK